MADGSETPAGADRRERRWGTDAYDGEWVHAIERGAEARARWIDDDAPPSPARATERTGTGAPPAQGDPDA